jgi:hypothetical protein
MRASFPCRVSGKRSGGEGKNVWYSCEFETFGGRIEGMVDPSVFHRCPEAGSDVEVKCDLKLTGIQEARGGQGKSYTKWVFVPHILDVIPAGAEQPAPAASRRAS